MTTQSFERSGSIVCGRGRAFFCLSRSDDIQKPISGIDRLPSPHHIRNAGVFAILQQVTGGFIGGWTRARCNAKVEFVIIGQSQVDEREIPLIRLTNLEVEKYRGDEAGQWVQIDLDTVSTPPNDALERVRSATNISEEQRERMIETITAEFRYW